MFAAALRRRAGARRPAALLSSGGAKPDRKRLDAGRHDRRGPFHRPRQLDLAEPAQHGLDDMAYLEQRDIAAEADMRAVAEGEMRIRASRQVEAEGIGKD